MEYWDVLVVGDGPAALRAALASTSAGARTMLLSEGGLGHSGIGLAENAIAASLLESTTKGHRDDTIRTGGWLCDQDIVSSRASSAASIIAELERWGLAFRRDSAGLPHSFAGLGHTTPRVSGCGDGTTRGVQQVLEERCIRDNIHRRGECFPLKLIVEESHIRGLIYYDLSQGRIDVIQAKAIILADAGFEGAWNGVSNGGTGMAIAARAGISLRNLEFQSWSPLNVAGTNLNLPNGLLANGGSIISPTGEVIGAKGSLSPTQIAAAMTAEGAGCVLDSRHISGDGSAWYAHTISLLNQRTGLDLGSDVIPVQPSVSATIGGIPADEHGRAVNGEWGKWMSGLYAVGDAASSGFHGASMAWGNRLLDDLLSGRDAGDHAGKWAAASKAASSSLLEESRQEVEANINERLLNDSGSSKIGAVRSSLRNELNAGMSLQRDGESLETCLAGLAQLKDISATANVEDSSLLMNTNLLEALRLENGCLLAHMATSAALSRCESRGSHLRSDNVQQDNDNCLKHSLVSMEGDVSDLPIRMSAGGVWILAPEV